MRTLQLLSSALVAGILLSGCGHDDENKVEEPKVENPSYKITVKNLTYSQVIAPITAAYHSKDTALFSIGEMASLGLEKLAEGGDGIDLVAELSKNTKVKQSLSATAPILPGKSGSVTLQAATTDCISVVGMLANTNDGFMGVNCLDTTAMKVGETITQPFNAYDAGTEINSEAKGTIPGPADGGEGFNALRADRNFITMHSGVITKDDGLDTSVLTQAHRWDNPVGTITIERIK